MREGHAFSGARESSALTDRGPHACAAARSRDFWIATAFVGSDAVEDIIGAALESGSKVRLLTGTFGNNTRTSTFRRLLALQKRGLETRIWDSGWHRRLHAKLYFWRLPGGTEVGWIGSANFTAGGLQEDGELILEVHGRAGSDMLAQLGRAFLREWRRGAPLDARFVSEYKEAPRPAPDIRIAPLRRHRTERVRRRTARPGRPNFIAHVDHYFSERKEKELVALLSGTARSADFFVTPTKSLRSARVGDRGLFIDLIAREAAPVEILDTARAGRRRIVVAYQPLFARRGRIDWNVSAARRAGQAIGAVAQGRSLRDRRLSSSQFAALIGALYPGRRLSDVVP